MLLASASPEVYSFFALCACCCVVGSLVLIAVMEKREYTLDIIHTYNFYILVFI